MLPLVFTDYTRSPLGEFDVAVPANVGQATSVYIACGAEGAEPMKNDLDARTSQFKTNPAHEKSAKRLLNKYTFRPFFLPFFVGWSALG